MFLPEEDRYSYSKRRIESQIAACSAAASPRNWSSARSSDDRRLERHRARDRPRAQHGHASGACPTSSARWPTGEDEGEVFLGRSVTQHKHVSDVTAHEIDEEIRRVDRQQLWPGAQDLDATTATSSTSMAEALIEVRDASTKSRSRTSWPAARRGRPSRLDGVGTRRAAAQGAPEAGAGHRPAGQRRPEPAAARGAPRRPPLPQRPAPMHLQCGRYRIELGRPWSWVCSTSRRIPFPTAGTSSNRPRRAIAHAQLMARRAQRSSTSAANRRGPARRRSRSSEELRRVMPVVERACAAPPSRCRSIRASQKSCARRSRPARHGQRRARLARARARSKRSRQQARPCASCTCRASRGTMQAAPHYDDVVSEVRTFCAAARRLPSGRHRP